MKTIYLGNLPLTVTEEEVAALFGQHGEVQKVSLVKDLTTGAPRGFGFVEMPLDDAERAIDALDGQQYEGHMLRVNEARDRGARPPRRSW
jgi:RNA recognition motif-containing protein